MSDGAGAPNSEQNSGRHGRRSSRKARQQNNIAASELLSLRVRLPHEDGTTETLTEMFVAPPSIVRAFAEFLASREDDEAFSVKHCPVRFQDVSVYCGDSKQAVAAYECLKHYDIPLSNYAICDELVAVPEDDSDDSASVDHSVNCNASSHLYVAWAHDHNYARFKAWYSANREKLLEDNALGD